jgi:hypothetical protein
LNASLINIMQSLRKKIMVMLNEDSIENFIRNNKDKFGVYRPPDNHLEKFLFKLNYRIREIISIVPYLIRVAVATVIIFLASIIVWNNFIRKDRHEMTLTNKISLVINKLKAY